MSKIANSVARLITLRDGIKNKLIDFSIISDESATLSDCKDAINGISNSTLTAPTISISPSITIANSTGVITASGSGSGTAKLSKGFCKGLSATTAVKASSSKGLTTQGAQTITPKTYNQTIAANRWLTGAQTIKGDANLVASNIRAGANIFDVAGSLQSLATWTGQSTYTRSGQVPVDEFYSDSSLAWGYIIDIYNIGFTPIFATAVGWRAENKWLSSGYVRATGTPGSGDATGGTYYHTYQDGTVGYYHIIKNYSSTWNNTKNRPELKFDSSQVSIVFMSSGDLSPSPDKTAVFDIQIFGHY